MIAEMVQTQNGKGAVLWEGPSTVDGRPIVVIVTGLMPRPVQYVNQKTGDMVQLWILPRDVSPIDALRSDKNGSICGSCPHQGYAGQGRSCYVDIRLPQTIWLAYQRGAYPYALPHVLRNRPVRLGAYGDPVAVPLFVFERLIEHISGWTGYTHLWRTCDIAWSGILMASVDSANEQYEAQTAGWRTFRVRTAHEPLRAHEIACPASDEGGHKSTCVKCRLCDGTQTNDDRRKNIAIIAHGRAGKANFQRRRNAEKQGVLPRIPLLRVL